MCRRCGGTGMVFRETRKETQTVTRHGYEHGRLITFDETVETTIGGPDACPECAALAEMEYRTLSAHAERPAMVQEKVA